MRLIRNTAWPLACVLGLALSASQAAFANGGTPPTATPAPEATGHTPVASPMHWLGFTWCMGQTATPAAGCDFRLPASHTSPATAQSPIARWINRLEHSLHTHATNTHARTRTHSSG